MPDITNTNEFSKARLNMAFEETLLSAMLLVIRPNDASNTITPIHEITVDGMFCCT